MSAILPVAVTYRPEYLVRLPPPWPSSPFFGAPCTREGTSRGSASPSPSAHPHLPPRSEQQERWLLSSAGACSLATTSTSASLLGIVAGPAGRASLRIECTRYRDAISNMLTVSYRGNTSRELGVRGLGETPSTFWQKHLPRPQKRRYLITSFRLAALTGLTAPMYVCLCIYRK